MRIWNPNTSSYTIAGETVDVSAYLADMTAFGASLIDDPSAASGAATLGLGGAGWQTYTPVWTTDGTAPALNNGTLTGVYLWRPTNNLLSFYINFQAGSTTTYGTNGWHFTTPPGFTILGAQAVTANCLDISAPSVRACSAVTSGSQLSNIAHGAGYITNTSPMTWAVNDTLAIAGTVRATSP